MCAARNECNQDKAQRDKPFDACVAGDEWTHCGIEQRMEAVPQNGYPKANNPGRGEAPGGIGVGDDNRGEERETRRERERGITPTTLQHTQTREPRTPDRVVCPTSRGAPPRALSATARDAAGRNAGGRGVCDGESATGRDPMNGGMGYGDHWP